MHDLEEGEFVLSDYLDDVYRDDYFDDSYVFSDLPNAGLLNDFYENNKGLFKVNDTYSRQNTDPDSYAGNEYVFATYAMATLQVKKLEIVGGVRYEATGADYTGNIVTFDEDGDYVNTQSVNTNKSFDGFFPSLNLKYSLGENTNIRAAVTKSLSRPRYYDLVPWLEVEQRRERIKSGNPDLVESISINYDFLIEHYFKSVGILSGGIFAKSIDDYIYDARFTQEGGIYDGWERRQALNGAEAKLWGFEIAWQQQFTFLPGFLNGFGIYANYTYVDSEFKIVGLENTERTVKLPDMRPQVGNLALSYEKYGFSSRLALAFYDSFITDLGGTPEEDELEDSRAQLDFSASQKMGEHFSVFIGLNNLTNSLQSFKFGDGRPFDDRSYSRRGNIGVKYKF